MNGQQGVEGFGCCAPLRHRHVMCFMQLISKRANVTVPKANVVIVVLCWHAARTSEPAPGPVIVYLEWERVRTPGFAKLTKGESDAVKLAAWEQYVGDVRELQRERQLSTGPLPAVQEGLRNRTGRLHRTSGADAGLVQRTQLWWERGRNPTPWQPPPAFFSRVLRNPYVFHSLSMQAALAMARACALMAALQWATSHSSPPWPSWPASTSPWGRASTAS